MLDPRAVKMIRCIFHVSVTRSAMCRRARMVQRRHLRAANRGGGPCANLQCISSYTQLVFARTPQPRSVLKSGAISRKDEREAGLSAKTSLNVRGSTGE